MIPRVLQPVLERRTRESPVVFLTGPRQSGKTTLARATFPTFEYLSLEDLSNRRFATDDPRGFLSRLASFPGAILDEVQNTPELFSYIQGFVDERRGGPLLLTGSQQFLLSEKISQSLAGRAAVLELLPFSVAELEGRQARTPEQLGERMPPRTAEERPAHALHATLHSTLLRGFFPPIHDRALEPRPWLESYLRTYVERDVRLVSGVGDLDAFARFLALCAGRVGSLLNLSSLGADAGVSHVTAKKWISILRASYVLELATPHHANVSKRLIKSPKLYFLDTGLLSALLGIRGAEDLASHPLRGGIFESFVYAELRKVFLQQGERPAIHFYRDSRGREVDFIVDLGRRRIPIEAKSGETVASDAFHGLDFYADLAGGGGGILVTGANDSYRRGRHTVVPWWDVS